MRPLPLPEEEVVRLYLGGETTVSLAKHFRCSRMPITRILNRAGVLRTVSEDNLRRYSKMTAEQIAAQTEAAHAGARGRKASLSELELRAKTKEGRPHSPNEMSVAQELAKIGIVAEVGKAVGIWNLDLAVGMLAIELDGGQWHGSGRKAAQDRRKEAALTALGWTVIRYRDRALKHPELIAIDIKLIRADPSVASSHRVIRRGVYDLLMSLQAHHGSIPRRYENVLNGVDGAIVSEDSRSNPDL